MFLAAALSGIIAVLLSTLYYISRWKYDYWKKQKVPYLKPSPIVGNYGDYILQKKYLGTVTQDILRQFPNEPYVGAFYGTEPVLLVQDPEIIKLVAIKDFYYFNGREATKYSHKEIFTRSLFGDGGDSWKVARQNLTPLFSSAKMRNMFHLIEKCAIELEALLANDSELRNNCEARTFIARFTMACICSCAFVVDIETLRSNPETNMFIKMGQIIFESSTIRGLLNTTRSIWPKIFYWLRLETMPTSLFDFFNKFLIEVFQGRHYKPTTRNDFIDLLLQLKEKEYVVGDSISNSKTGENKRLQMAITDRFMVAQSIVFFAAGFETSAATTSHTLFELAKRPDALKKAQKEIDEFLKNHDNKLVYDCITELPYTEACVDEVLRIYPVLPIVAQEVVEDYTFPSGLTLHKGVRVHIPIYHMHHNSKFFPEPHKFRPERFLPPEKDTIIPQTYIPFGEGPRICIGMRFAKMQILSGLVTVLKSYNVELAESMPSKLELNPRSSVTQSYEGIYLKLTPREDSQTPFFAK